MWLPFPSGRARRAASAQEPAPVPVKMYGQFYDGDAYIVLKTTQKPSSSSLEWVLFFWLGEASKFFAIPNFLFVVLRNSKFCGFDPRGFCGPP